MDAVLIYVLVWVLPSVGIGVAAGFFLGRASSPPTAANQEMDRQRAQMLKSMLVLLQSTEQLSNDVEGHKSELEQAGRFVEDLNLPGEFQDLQQQFLGQIRAVVESNQRLEDDLVCAHYRLETQTRELDRTRQEARTDALSGVANRKAFDETLQYLVADYKRAGTSFALVLGDVDHFKWINDTHGHPAGDRVVAHVGQFLNSCVRSGDVVARYGGDEFALMLVHVDADTAISIAERIRSGVTRRNFDIGLRGECVSVTFSMGLASVCDGDTAESLLERADNALYRSKQGGRNQLHAYRDQQTVVNCSSKPSGEFNADEAHAAETAEAC